VGSGAFGGDGRRRNIGYLCVMLGLGAGSCFEQPFRPEPWTFGLADPYPFGYGVTYRASELPALGITLDDDQVESAVVAASWSSSHAWVSAGEVVHHLCGGQ
jgi:hypothetical protein